MSDSLLIENVDLRAYASRLSLEREALREQKEEAVKRREEAEEKERRNNRDVKKRW